MGAPEMAGWNVVPPLLVLVALGSGAPPAPELELVIGAPKRAIPALRPWLARASRVLPGLAPSRLRRRLRAIGVDPFEPGSLRAAGWDPERPMRIELGPEGLGVIAWRARPASSRRARVPADVSARPGSGEKPPDERDAPAQLFGPRRAPWAIAARGALVALSGPPPRRSLFAPPPDPAAARRRLERLDAPPRRAPPGLGVSARLGSRRLRGRAELAKERIALTGRVEGLRLRARAPIGPIRRAVAGARGALSPPRLAALLPEALRQVPVDGRFAVHLGADGGLELQLGTRGPAPRLAELEGEPEVVREDGRLTLRFSPGRTSSAAAGAEEVCPLPERGHLRVWGRPNALLRALGAVTPGLVPSAARVALRVGWGPALRSVRCARAGIDRRGRFAGELVASGE